MTIRIDLPGGQWADLRTVDELTGADQDAFLDLFDQLMEAKPEPEQKVNPANPAEMLPAPPRRLTTADNMLLRDMEIGRIISAWSFDIPLPYTREARSKLPLPVCNALLKATEPIRDAIQGNEDATPKSPEPSPGSGGSTGTSPESTGSPLPVPPAALSAMP